MHVSVIHEEPDFLVLDKPAGIAVHRGTGTRRETIVDWLLERYPEIRSVGDNLEERPGIVHRLDKDTSGVMVVARNQKSFETLKQLFKSRAVRKTYVALVVGVPREKRGVIETPLGRSVRTPVKRAIGSRAAGTLRGARTEYRVLEAFADHALLAVEPKTGRMHQIRVHLASIGHPVAGDRLYGGKRAELEGLDRHFLHAASLEFSYPEGRRVRFEAVLPSNLKRLLATLRSKKGGHR